jgi:hypothetical protein
MQALITAANRDAVTVLAAMLLLSLVALSRIAR